MKKGYEKNRRRNYFIEKRFQSEFIMKFCLLVVLTALISAYVIYRFSMNSVTTVFENSRLVIKPSSEYLLPGIALGSLTAIAIVGISTIGMVLFISHRIAGPLYKARKCLERMSGGDLGFDVNLRSTDEVKEIADALNAAVADLNRLVADVKESAESLKDSVDYAAAAVEGEGADAKKAKRALGDVKERYNGLKEKINRFILK